MIFTFKLIYLLVIFFYNLYQYLFIIDHYFYHLNLIFLFKRMHLKKLFLFIHSLRNTICFSFSSLIITLFVLIIFLYVVFSFNWLCILIIIFSNCYLKWDMFYQNDVNTNYFILFETEIYKFHRLFIMVGADIGFN